MDKVDKKGMYKGAVVSNSILGSNAVRKNGVLAWGFIKGIRDGSIIQKEGVWVKKGTK